MAGNTRGKLKEEFEGMHTNFEWVKKHCVKSLVLIKEHNPKLTGSIEALADMINTLDDLAQKIYGSL